MSLLIVTDSLRGDGVWPAWLRAEGYEVVCQNLSMGGLVLNPYARFPVILMHLSASPIEQALAAVRIFHTCHADAHIIAVTLGNTDNQAFTEAGATVALSEPVDPALVFKMVDLLSRRTQQTPATKTRSIPRRQSKRPLWEKASLAQRAD